jgi:hypothetical protein
VANTREHATLRRRPIDLLAEERPRLLPLKSTSTFEGLLVEERRVGRNAFVTFEGNRYAVPWRYAGRHVSVVASEAHVRIRWRSTVGRPKKWTVHACCTHEPPLEPRSWLCLRFRRPWWGSVAARSAWVA